MVRGQALHYRSPDSATTAGDHTYIRIPSVQPVRRPTASQIS